ncbi:spermidine synthase [Neobacillus sp. PS3-34]|uniref:spermine/spermidine synthase domain-containing protein n=1 Tax=Neobacillus sp. PS3-34 TaxID=3070678 RepID=UPI0027E03594|nr:spermidine synthase [Neobacillus sp. PS3-34]WML49015.1 spermidine synthase [Neobacillus sp. PS3-34]
MNRRQRRKKARFSHKYNHNTNTTLQHKDTPNYFADKWDRIGLHSILNGKHKNLLKVKSDFQNIHIVKTSDIRMYLNEQLQFSSLDERIYHEALVHPAFCLARKRKRVLIVGGGDGLAVREVLKYKDVKRVDLVDLDPEVLKAAKNNPSLAALNDYSLYDSRVKLHPVDAVEFLASKHSPYHIIIVDFPDPTDRIISDLYTIEFYSLLKRSLADDGLFVCQSNSPQETPIVFWSIRKTIEGAGFSTLSYHTIVPSFGDWGFHIGSPKSLRWSKKRVEVQHQTLPSKLKDMAYFPRAMLRGQRAAVVNTKKKSVLHDIFIKEILFLSEAVSKI